MLAKVANLGPTQMLANMIGQGQGGCCSTMVIMLSKSMSSFLFLSLNDETTGILYLNFIIVDVPSVEAEPPL